MTESMAWGSSTLHFGDAIDCDYPWLPPRKLDDYAGDLRRVNRQVRAAKESLDFLERVPSPAPVPGPIEATLPVEERIRVPATDGGVPAAPTVPVPRCGTGDNEGLALEAMHRRGTALNTRFTDLNVDLRGVAEAIENYATALRTYRDQVGELLDYARRRDLQVRNDKIYAPVSMLPQGASQQQADAWEADWRSYAACFEWIRDIRADRRKAINEMIRALREHAGVEPRDREPTPKQVGGSGAPDFGNGEVRKLRRAAARAAAEALAAREEARTAQREAREARRALEAADAELTRLRRSGADPAVIAEQETAVHEARSRSDRASQTEADTQARAERATEAAQRAAADHQEARDRRDGKSGITYARV